jgi:hypothetical protein
MMTPKLVLSDLTLNAIQMEATRAHLVHGEYSMLGPHYTNRDRLAILAEEAGEVSEEVEALIAGLLNARLQAAVGRVAHELTYDQGGPGVGEGDRDKLVIELIQVAAMAASWVEALEGGGG